MGNGPQGCKQSDMTKVTEHAYKAYLGDDSFHIYIYMSSGDKSKLEIYIVE